MGTQRYLLVAGAAVLAVMLVSGCKQCEAGSCCIADCDVGFDATPPPQDAAVDLDAEIPPGRDAGLDAGLDVGVDVGVDVGPFACPDGGFCEEACPEGFTTQPWLSVNRWQYNGGTSVTLLAFLNYLSAEPQRCQWTKVDEHCALFNCLEADWPGETIRGPSAGDITVSKADNQSILSPDLDGIYAGVYPPFTFEAGEVATVTGTGDVIPAFSGEVPMPAALLVTSPERPPRLVALEIDRTQDLVIAWVPSDEAVMVDFAQTPDPGLTWDRQELICLFDGAVGTGTVTSAALKKLRAGPDFKTNGFGVANVARRCARLGDTVVQFGALHGPWYGTVVYK